MNDAYLTMNEPHAKFIYKDSFSGMQSRICVHVKFNDKIIHI